MILVTGGTGFLGRHTVELLLASKKRVRVLARRRDALLEGLGAEVVIGDVTDPATLPAAFAGATAAIHMAGRVERTQGAADELYQVHVDGTRNVLREAARAGIGRFVHVSTSGTRAVSERSDPIRNEESGYATEVVRAFPYYLSKIYGEKIALEAFSPGVRLEDRPERVRVPVVVVQPSLLLGPGEGALSSAKDVVRFLKREVPAVPPGGVNFVDVRDAALATTAALEKGRPGECYLIGGQNMSVEAFFVLLEKVSGVKAPTIALSPKFQELAARAVAGFESLFERAHESGDFATALAMGGKFWYLDSAKARAELGFVARPAEQTLADTVDWLRASGPLPSQGGVLGRALRGVNQVLGTRR
jgi:dihydroflavonol-4-reductase